MDHIQDTFTVLSQDSYKLIPIKMVSEQVIQTILRQILDQFPPTYSSAHHPTHPIQLADKIQLIKAFNRTQKVSQMPKPRSQLRPNKSHQPSTTFLLQMNVSHYSQLYARYMREEYSQVDLLLKQFITLDCCSQFYLKYPLEGLLRGICKKMMINVYEFIVYGYFLSSVQWKLDQHYLYSNLAQVLPNIMHVNEPTNSEKLKELSMFLYFSCYSVKEFLNQDMSMLKSQMIKIFPQFEPLQAHWTSSQDTVGHILNPRALNAFFKQTNNLRTLSDYNTCVDRILQISPCYDIASRNDKPKGLPSFGFMINHNEVYDYPEHIKIEQNMDDYHFDGQI